MAAGIERMGTNNKPRVEPLPYEPVEYELADAGAIQALAKGEALPHQQQRVLNWVLNKAAATYDLEYRTDGRDHAFVSGRRFVGLQVLKLLKLNIGALSAIEARRQQPDNEE